MILIEENIYVIEDEKMIIVIDEYQQGNNCSKEQSICQDYIDICQYYQASLENSQFNSNSIYDWVGTEEAKVCLLVNFLFLDFYIPFLFVMISKRVFHFVDRTDLRYKCADFFSDFKEFFFSNKITIF